MTLTYSLTPSHLTAHTESRQRETEVRGMNKKKKRYVICETKSRLEIATTLVAYAP